MIFSCWQEALDLIMEAFTRAGVKFVRLEGANGKGKKEGVVKRFQDDPDIAAFFLHTRSQSAGLNLTVARYVRLHSLPPARARVVLMSPSLSRQVFLVEPLLTGHLELQAVARVHRITQTKPTCALPPQLANPALLLIRAAHQRRLPVRRHRHGRPSRCRPARCASFEPPALAVSC